MTEQSKAVTALGIARKLAALGQADEACRAYAIAAVDEKDVQPLERLESALYILQNGGDYKVAYTAFLSLFAKGHFQNEILNIVLGAFYEPNVKQLKKRYEKNCKRLQKYPYLFRKDFPAFEDLPVIFIPYDDNGYVPYYISEQRFGEVVNFNDPVISHYFFSDLEKPVLGTDVYSFYELAYLNDNVRKSEWVARENHIYLHYTNWGIFCAHLACWNLGKILDDEKFVFLIGEEISRYPIDFKAEFGIDYSKYPVRPIHIDEITRLIWHTQLSSHNGGDFFNEVFHGHPNLLWMDSVMMDEIETGLNAVVKGLRSSRQGGRAEFFLAMKHVENQKLNLEIASDEYQMLARMGQVTIKDVWVAVMLRNAELIGCPVDPSCRITPAVFYQPHFGIMECTVNLDEHGRAMQQSVEYERILQSPLLNGFKYVKTFTPMRRVTTSYAAAIRYILYHEEGGREKWKRERKETELVGVGDYILTRALNRSYLIDTQERLFRDSILVRFEDGKLNPRATFTALAEFLDIPYTESMTRCSSYMGMDPESTKGNVRGFDTASVYKKYDEFATDAERAFIEYMFRDAYAYYGYDFHYYDGEPMSRERMEELLAGFTVSNRIATGVYNLDGSKTEQYLNLPQDVKMAYRLKAEVLLADMATNRRETVHAFENGLKFVNKNGQPLRMMPLLKLDPALLETELYH